MNKRTVFQLIITVSALFNANNIHSQKLLGEIKIGDNYRNITNLSGALNDSISFHLIINKNKEEKTFESTIYFFDSEGLTKEFKIGTDPDKPNYLTFHSNNDILTLTKSANEKTIIQDIDYANEKSNSTEINTGTYSVFSLPNMTFLVLGKNETLIDFAFVNSSIDVGRYFYQFNTKTEKGFLKNMDNNNMALVDETHFVDKGFIEDVKAFYRSPSLLLVQDDRKDNVVNLLEMAPKLTVQLRQIALDTHEKLKDLDSFLVDNLLFAFAMEKNEATLFIYDLETDKLIKTFEYNSDNFGIAHKVVVNGDDETNSFNSRRFFKSFFPQAVGSVYNAELYIGVNKTSQNGYVVQVGHVDKNTFRNANSGNFWWTYPAFGLNYNLSTGSLGGGFNPAGMSMMIFNALADNKRKGNYFELNLDSELNPVKETPELKFMDDTIDLDLYEERLGKMFDLNNYFLIPMATEVRFINFDKKTDSYKVYSIHRM